MSTTALSPTYPKTQPKGVDMQRRGFLGLFAGAVAAKPDPSILFETPPGLAFNVHRGTHGYEASEGFDKIGWGKKRLKKLFGLTKAAEALEMKRHYISGLDADTAALRSMSNVAKLRRTRAIQYRLAKQEEISTLEGIVSGLIE